MDDLTQEQIAQQKAYLDEELRKGVAFEAIKNSEAYAYLQAYYENLIKTFSTKAINQGFDTLDAFNLERGKVLGVKLMFDGIMSSLTTLEEQRKKTKDNENEQTQ